MPTEWVAPQFELILDGEKCTILVFGWSFLQYNDQKQEWSSGISMAALLPLHILTYQSNYYDYCASCLRYVNHPYDFHISVSLHSLLRTFLFMSPGVGAHVWGSGWSRTSCPYKECYPAQRDNISIVEQLDVSACRDVWMLEGNLPTDGLKSVRVIYRAIATHNVLCLLEFFFLYIYCLIEQSSWFETYFLWGLESLLTRIDAATTVTLRGWMKHH